MDRKTLKVPFTLDTPKNWACPTCQSGMLGIKADTFHKYEIHNSRNHSHENWDPDWISYTFSAESNGRMLRINLVPRHFSVSNSGHEQE